MLLAPTTSSSASIQKIQSPQERSIVALRAASNPISSGDSAGKTVNATFGKSASTSAIRSRVRSSVFSSSAITTSSTQSTTERSARLIDSCAFFTIMHSETVSRGAIVENLRT